MSNKRIHLIIGPLLFFILINLPFEGLSKEGLAVLACTVWVAYWWITEALELAVTSLLPIVIFPLSNAAPIAEVTSAYGQDRKSTRLNSSHVKTSYAVFCLKK